MSAYTDWQPNFEKLFNLHKVGSILEFGLGAGTTFLLDNCKHVTSLELGEDPSIKEWCEKTREELKDRNNWDCVYHKCPDEFNKALEGYIIKFIEGKKFDMAFVDPGIHCRPEIVNLLFNKVDIIAAHDTMHGQDAYHWDRIKCPDNYFEYKVDHGQGTTFWFKDKKLGELYAQS